MANRSTSINHRVTLKDVAAAAGVHYTCVGVVLNNTKSKATVSEATRNRILETAEELGYRRNELARAVVTGHNRVLGFLSRQATALPASMILSGALEEAQAHGYLLKILPHAPDTVSRCADWRLAGVLSLHTRAEDLHAMQVEESRSGLLAIQVDVPLPPDSGVCVISDDAHGMELAVQHLKELGHHRIAYLGGYNWEVRPPLTRDSHFLNAMSRYGLEVSEHAVWNGHWTPEAAAAGTQHLLSLTPTPTAIICAGDDPLTPVVLRTARQMGFSVPRDLSVVGYGDLPISLLTDPPLTSVAQPFQEMGRVAVRYLLQELGELSEGDGTNFVLPTTLTIRESTTHPRSV